MDNKTQELLQNLKNNQGAVQAIMGSRDGQALLRQLAAQDGGAALQKAAMSAARGDTAQLAQMLQQLMSRQDGAELIRRINDSMQK